MKFIFSLVLLTSFNSFARDKVVIHYQSEAIEQAKLVRSALINQLDLPKEFIRLEMSLCQSSFDSIATICIDENHEVKIVQQNSKVMKKILRAFRGQDERQ
ncbi:MAG: hypothetical protein COW01_03940 [Bdellovibrionales bacterium CG12_big_fil_rev_8_21_14_0_65_38_15]|nr:MAG: hypothetical protein COW79_13000 [Bdellovibrionales bacterium CG22_combo_CG10-13_8_21_14_all_38_13]PIQ56614.1 MAG: hypothetical protein COW01_03940 [Bdellovibrionales bacterium CG12_big_fil_rev_8_21_14_0_65_38_15]PIR31269.1 MAG: hypothetical protein COV38_01550 [Bdellovibrionales bacterium CG11_big_fil_rev_8_21_14_0_20_38_13]